MSNKSHHLDLPNESSPKGLLFLPNASPGSSLDEVQAYGTPSFSTPLLSIERVDNRRESCHIEPPGLVPNVAIRTDGFE